MNRGILGPGTLVLGGGAVILVGFLAVGYALPGTWEASADTVLALPPDAVAPLLDAPEGWRAWTAWPDSGLVRFGPGRGGGASVSWNDRELGSGTFTVEQVDADGSVAYSVEVAGVGGSGMRTTGTIALERVPGGTRVTWREHGDLGSNPLMGWWARSMRRAQSAEMAKGLARLGTAAAARRPASDRHPTTDSIA